MSTGTGTFQDPIIAMSGDPAQIARDIRASLAHFNRTDDPYWVEKESAPAQFSNGLWFLGHNRYWEVRMDPANPGSADPNLGRQPALFWTTVTVPVPPGIVPPDAVPPTTVTDVRLFTLLTLLTSAVAELQDQHARLDILNGRLETVQMQLTALALRPFPTYSGRVLGGIFGGVTVTLTPVVPK